MKRLSIILITMLIISTISSCGKNSSDNSQPSTSSAEAVKDNTSSAKDIERELSSISNGLKSAYDDYCDLASTITSNWNTSSDVMNYFFDEKYCKEGNLYKDSQHKSRYDRFWNLKNSTDEDFASLQDRIKNVDSTDTTADYYTAVKDYYKSINVLKQLITDFPSGYSKMTYAAAINDAKEDCAAAQSELSFYN